MLFRTVYKIPAKREGGKGGAEFFFSMFSAHTVKKRKLLLGALVVKVTRYRGDRGDGTKWRGWGGVRRGGDYQGLVCQVVTAQYPDLMFTSLAGSGSEHTCLHVILFVFW